MIKIAILGPESTGKSTLAESLAGHFVATWLPEYAREYVEKLTLPYIYDDVCNIARKQIEQQLYFEKYQPTNYIFFDTELIITKVWFEYKFKIVPDFVTEQLKSNFFDMFGTCFCFASRFEKSFNCIYF